jgi:sensor domain CHASE-containing protein
MRAEVAGKIRRMSDQVLFEIMLRQRLAKLEGRVVTIGGPMLRIRAHGVITTGGKAGTAGTSTFFLKFALKFAPELLDKICAEVMECIRTARAHGVDLEAQLESESKITDDGGMIASVRLVPPK